MNIVVCCKFTPNTQDIEIRSDGSFSLDMAEWQISEYDLQAIEAGVQLATATGGKLMALSVGSSRIEAPQLRKDLLSRGPEELYVVADTRLADADTALVGKVLVEAIKKLEADVALFGEGSADYYYQQAGLQVGQRLGWATLNAVDAIEPAGDGLRVERLLENEIEELNVTLPAALSVTSGMNTPPMPGMKAILSAGKKPFEVWSLDDLGMVDVQPGIENRDMSAPPAADRKSEVFEGGVQEAVGQLVAALDSEGLL